MKQRQSNIELLRILAIFCVLIQHGLWYGVDLPTNASISANPCNELMSFFLRSATIGNVDVFILISGWFGIHFSWRGLSKFIYQLFFLLWLIFFVTLAANRSTIDITGIKATMGIYDGYWFVMAYLGMYILSPVLNAFVETASKRQFSLLLIAFYAFQCYYCWGWGMVNYFNGYSIVFFCGLYLTSRYVRLYSVKILEEHSFLIYIISTLVIMSVATLGLWYFDSPIRMWRYDNPIAILGAIGILIAFSKIDFTCRTINWFAKSCFAVYIIHFNPFVFPYFKEGMKLVTTNFKGLIYPFSIIFYFIFVYIVCSFVDGLRRGSWSFIQRRSWKYFEC